MKPTVTMSTKIRVLVAQKIKVCWGLAGPKSPMLNDPCQTTRITERTSTKTPDPKISRFFRCAGIGSFDYTWLTNRRVGWGEIHYGPDALAPGPLDWNLSWGSLTS